MKGKYYYNLLPDDIKIYWDNEYCYYHNYGVVVGDFFNTHKNNFLEKDKNSFNEFISSSFVWSGTKKGTKFWRKISNLDEQDLIRNKRDEKLNKLGI